jgi:hypothetical protein
MLASLLTLLLCATPPQEPFPPSPITIGGGGYVGAGATFPPFLAAQLGLFGEGTLGNLLLQLDGSLTTDSIPLPYVSSPVYVMGTVGVLVGGQHFLIDDRLALFALVGPAIGTLTTQVTDQASPYDTEPALGLGLTGGVHVSILPWLGARVAVKAIGQYALIHGAAFGTLSFTAGPVLRFGLGES